MGRKATKLVILLSLSATLNVWMHHWVIKFPGF